MQLSTLLLVLLSVVVANAALDFATTDCTVSYNNYPATPCSGEAPPGGSDMPSGMPYMKRAGPFLYSCQSDDSGSMAYGQIQVTFTIGNNMTYYPVVCNPANCMPGPSKGEVQSWLGTVTKGKVLTCYYSASKPTTAYIDANAICTNHGTYNKASNTCTCTDGYIGDSCDTMPQDSSNPTGSASALFVSSFVAVVVLVALLV